MRRNVERQIEIGRKLLDKHPYSDMTVDEMKEIINKYDGNSVMNQLFYSVTDAFLMGVAVGSRIRK